MHRKGNALDLPAIRGGCNGKSDNRHIRILMAGMKQRHPLRTQTGRVSGILLITAGYDRAVLQQSCRSDMKLRIRGIRLSRRFYAAPLTATLLPVVRQEK